jgi:hypothetical protein
VTFYLGSKRAGLFALSKLDILVDPARQVPVGDVWAVGLRIKIKNKIFTSYKASTSPQQKKKAKVKIKSII